MQLVCARTRERSRSCWEAGMRAPPWGRDFTWREAWGTRPRFWRLRCGRSSGAWPCARADRGREGRQSAATWRYGSHSEGGTSGWRRSYGRLCDWVCALRFSRGRSRQREQSTLGPPHSRAPEWPPQPPARSFELTPGPFLAPAFHPESPPPSASPPPAFPHAALAPTPPVLKQPVGTVALDVGSELV